MLKIFPLGDEVLGLLPAADSSKKKQFTASQITALASKILSPSSEMSDNIYSEWNRYRLRNETCSESEALPSFWKTMGENYPYLSVLMQAVLCVPHSNAASERVFSMLKKIYTEQRSELCSDSINSLLSIKLNIDTCCYNTELSGELLKKLKKAAMLYNESRGGAGASAQETPEEAADLGL